MSDFHARLRGPMIATEAMGLAVFALRYALLDILPARVPFPFSSQGASEVTIVLIAGVALGILFCVGFLRTIDPQTYRGLMRTMAMVLRFSGLRRMG